MAQVNGLAPRITEADISAMEETSSGSNNETKGAARG